MSRAIAVVAGLLGIVVLITLLSSFYFVQQTEEALVLQFGAPQAVITEPGIHFKTPLTQNVVFIDKRVLLLDALPEEVIASDKKRSKFPVSYTLHSNGLKVRSYGFGEKASGRFRFQVTEVLNFPIRIPNRD